MINSILLKFRPDLIYSEFIKKLIRYIEEKGIKLFLDPEGLPKDYLSKYDTMELKDANSDIVIIAGGDGTMLYSILKLPKKCPPILGIYMGTIGFLAEITPDRFNWAIEKIIKGEYEVLTRLRLKAKVDEIDLPESINEVLITTTEPGKTIKIDVYIDEIFVNRLVGDGIIVATSVGSTAYSLSAGGSIIDGDLEAYTIVPICAFRSNFLPIVIPLNKIVTLKFVKEHKPYLIVIDGQFRHKVDNRASVTIQRSQNPVPFIRFEDNFYDKVREKLLT